MISLTLGKYEKEQWPWFPRTLVSQGWQLKPTKKCSVLQRDYIRYEDEKINKL